MAIQGNHEDGLQDQAGAGDGATGGAGASQSIVYNIYILGPVTPDILNAIIAQAQQGGGSGINIINQGPVPVAPNNVPNNSDLLAQLASYMSTASPSTPARPSPYGRRGRPTKEQSLIRQLQLLGVPVPAQNIAQNTGGMQLLMPQPQLPQPTVSARPQLSDFLRNLATSSTPSTSSIPSIPTIPTILSSPSIPSVVSTPSIPPTSSIPSFPSTAHASTPLQLASASPPAQDDNVCINCRVVKPDGVLRCGHKLCHQCKNALDLCPLRLCRSTMEGFITFHN